MATLKLRKMGMDFTHNPRYRELSDVDNYRVRTLDECIHGKDGRTYFLEFTVSDQYFFRKVSKRNGLPLKHPVKELHKECKLFLATEFTDETGSYRNCRLEKAIDELDYTYTTKSILRILDAISTDHFDSIEWIN